MIDKSEDVSKIIIVIRPGTTLRGRDAATIAYARHEGLMVEIVEEGSPVDSSMPRDIYVDMSQATRQDRETWIGCEHDLNPEESMKRNLPPPIRYIVYRLNGPDVIVHARMASEAMSYIQGATSALPWWLEADYEDNQGKEPDYIDLT